MEFWKKTLKKRLVIIELIIIFITALLEIFVFNFRAIQSCFYNNYIHDKSFNVENDNYNDKIIKFNEFGWINIYLNDINVVTKNMYIDLTYVDSKKNEIESEITINLQAQDEGSSLYYNIPSYTFYSDNEYTKYVALNLSGKTNSIHISIPSIQEADGVLVNQIDFNKRWLIHLSFLRAIFIFFLINYLYFLIHKNDLYNIPFAAMRCHKVVNYAAIIFPVIILLLVSNCTTIFRKNNYTQYHKLAEAFLEGNLYLNDEPSETVKNMENPYDTLLRDKLCNESGDSYYVDYAYYDGKYYVYFGALPVIVLFMPYYLITGTHLSTSAAISIIGIFFVLSIYTFTYAIFKKWHKNSSYIHFLMFYCLFFISAGFFYSFRGPQFYAIPNLLAGVLTFFGLTLLINEAGEHYRILNISIGSLLLALTATSRPQFLVALFFIPLLYLKNFFSSKTWKNKLQLLAAIGIPVLLIASVVMIYNFLRFGSITDFGANYNLTGNDMTHRGFHFDRIFLGLYYYLFIFPDWRVCFPYIYESAKTTSYEGFTWFEGMAGGFLSNHIITYINFGIIKAKKFFKDTQEYLFAATAIILAFIVVIVNTQMAGIFSRYIMDYGWLLCTSCMMIFLNIYENLNYNIIATKILNVVLAITLLYSFMYEFFLIFVEYTNGIIGGSDKLYYFIKTLFQFW